MAQLKVQLPSARSWVCVGHQKQSLPEPRVPRSARPMGGCLCGIGEGISYLCVHVLYHVLLSQAEEQYEDLEEDSQLTRVDWQDKYFTPAA